MDGTDSVYEMEVNGKWIYTGTLVHSGKNGEYLPPKQHRIVLHNREGGNYIVFIALSLLSAEGGDFDSDDTVYADIYSIDGKRMGPIPGARGVNPPGYHAGYVYGHHLDQYGDDKNQGPTAFVGRINKELVLRLFIQGDDWVSASYSVIEL